MTSFTSTNAQYYLLVGLLQDASAFSLDRCLERDMLALTHEVAPTDRWSTKGDVHHLAGLIIRTFEKAGIALSAEGDFTEAAKEQVVKDVFALHKQVKEFMSITWSGEKAQQEEIDTLATKTRTVAAHSRGVLARRKYAASI